MNKTKFMFSLLSSAREICCRAVDNIFKNKDFIAVLEDLPEVAAMLDVVDQQRIFTLKRWCCFISCLYFLNYVREHYFGIYYNLISDPSDYVILDSFVVFYSKSNKF